MAGINPTLGTPQAIAIGLDIGELMNDNTLVAPLWNPAVSYPKGMVVGYSFAPSPWAVATTYALGQLAGWQLTDGQYICAMSLQASNTGNVPYFGSPFWSYVTAAWDTILGVGNFAIQFQSLINNNVNNIPYGTGSSTTIGTSTAWQLAIGTNNVGPDPTQIIGANYYPPLMYVQNSETETTFNRNTVNASNNTTGVASNAVQGGFQLVTQAIGGAGTVRQDYNIAAALTILNPTLTFAVTGTLQVLVALTTTLGQPIVPGWYQVPALKFTSGTPTNMTVNATTGLLTGVLAGTSLITVTCGNLTATSTYTCM